MKPKVKFKLAKKIVYISLTAVVVFGLTACKVQPKDTEVITLENQQKEIQNVLPIKKMDKIDNFYSEYWLNNGDILGVVGNRQSYEYKDAPNVAIYDSKSKKLKNVSNNTDKGEVMIFMNDITKDQRYVLYSKHLKYRDENDDIYILDLKNKTEKKIEDKVDAVSEFADGNKFILAKGMKLYMCDVDGNKTEINLPQEMIKDMNDFSKLNSEKFIKIHFGNESIDEKTRKEMKERFEYVKVNNHIFFINQKGNEVLVRTYNFVSLIYNLKTNEYKKVTREESGKFSYPRKDDENEDVVKLERNAEGVQELWELDSNKEHKQLIAKGKLSRNITVSPDHKKVVYCSYGEKGEKNTFVYDLETGKSARIFKKITSLATWNESSNQFFIPTLTNSSKEGYHYEVTNVITLN